jgi:enolase
MIDLDGTENKSKLGANAILGVSMAIARAEAAHEKVPLWKLLNRLAGSPKAIMPVPMFNCINGGVHAGNFLAPQEFFLIPLGAPTFAEALRLGSETYHTLKGLIKEKYGLNSTAVGDEGGFAPDIAHPEEALQLLVAAIEKAGHSGKICIGADPASSEFYIKEKGVYDLDFKRGAETPHRLLTTDQMLEFWTDMSKKFPLVLLEDPFDENDFEGFTKITSMIGDTVEIVGDDLLCTNPKIVKKAVGLKAGNAMLLKLNQIGSVSESIEAYNICRSNNWGVFVSHRSGETDDSFIADLVVGLATGHIKTGAPCRGERLAKYNQLLRIERSDPSLGFAGKDFRKSGHF